MPPKSNPITLDRSTAVQLGVAGLLGSAGIVAETVTLGFSGGAFFSAALALAAKIGGDCIPNILAGLFAKKLDEKQANLDLHRRHQQNAHLQRIINLAIGESLKRFATTYQGSKSERDYLTQLAKAIQTNPLSIEIAAPAGLLNAPPSPIAESECINLLTGDAATVRQRKPLGVNQWVFLLGRFGHAHGLDSKADTNTIGNALKAAGTHLEADFMPELIAQMKQAGAGSDFAWPALIMRFLGEINQGVRDANVKLDSLIEAVKTLSDDVQAIVRWTATQAGAASPTTAEDIAFIKQQSLSWCRSLESIKPMLAQHGLQLDELVGQVNMIQHKLDELSSEVRSGFIGIQERLDRDRPRPQLLVARLDAPPHYVDRPALIDDIEQALNTADDDGKAALAGASGDGGQGKTYIARAYARQHRGRYPGGVVEVSMVDRRSLTAALAAALAPTPGEPPKETQAAAIVRQLLMAERSLLILDNVEDEAHWKALREETLGASGQPLLPGSPCHIIVTTRARGLAGCTDVHVGKMSLPEAAELLTKLGCRMPGGVDWAKLEEGRNSADPDAQAIFGIWRDIEGLAALVHAVGVKVSRARKLTWPEYAARVAACETTQLPDADEVIRKRLDYSRTAYSVLTDLRRSLDAAELRCLDYAAHLPQDATPAAWLHELLTAETAPGGKLAADRLGRDRAGEPRDAEGVIADLRDLELLRSTEVEPLVSVHALHRKLTRELAAADAREILTSIAEYAQLRRAVIVGKSINHPNVLTNRDLRWELTPLAGVCLALWEVGMPGEAARLAVWVGSVLQAVGRYRDALACLLPVGDHAAAVERAIGPAELASCTSNLATIQKDLGDLPAARANIEKAIAINLKHFDPDHPTLAVSYSNLAMIQKDLGDLPAARANMERAVAILRKHFDPDHPTLATSYNNLAHLCLAEGDRAEACRLWSRALAILRKHFNEDHPYIRSTLRAMQAAGCAL
ncbi:MAG: hypothetical protein FLDDKLPJ_00361 [Phycisphaerae bacterium]|nr:hypothetical protein [Phycisphaerae bacterium]